MLADERLVILEVFERDDSGFRDEEILDARAYPGMLSQCFSRPRED